jgi:WD40 repeat protein
MWRIAFLGLGVVLCQSSAAFPQEKASSARPNAQRKDADGLPLPAGAVARLGTLRGVDHETIGFLALSADGKKVATVPEWRNNPVLRIREAPSGKLLQEIPLKIKFWEDMAISPDFHKLAWTYLDDSVAIVDLATRKQTILNAPTKDARGAAVSFSSDGKKIIVTFKHHYSGLAPTRKGDSKQWVSMFDFEIVEWTLEDGNKRRLWKDKPGYRYRHVAFAPDGKVLALAYVKKKSAKDVADFEQEFVLADAAARQPRLTLPLKDGVDCLMEFSPDGKVLALADEESLKLIDLAQGKVRWTASYKGKIHRPEARLSSLKKAWPEKMAWHGSEVGVFFHVGELRTWRISDGTPARHYAAQATTPLAFAKDAPVLAFTQDGRSLQFLDTATGKALQPVEGHRNPPSVLFRSDGSLISHDERKICVWSGGDWRLRTSFEFPDKGQRFSFGPSQHFFVRTVGKKVEARNLKSGKLIKEWTLKSAADFVFLLPGGKTLAAGYLYQSEEPQYKGAERSCLRLLDVASGAQKEIPLPYRPWEVKVSPAKALLALKYRDDSRDYLDTLDTVSGKLQRLMDDPEVTFSLLDFAPDGRKVYFSSAPAESNFWPREMTLASVDLGSGKIAKHAELDRIHEAAFSPDGRLLVYSPKKLEHRVIDKYARIYTTPSNEIVVWETASKSVRARFDKTNAWVNSVSCSPDIRYFATGLHDSTILIWDALQLEEKK